MKNIAITALAAIALSSHASADAIDLEILYLGNEGSERAASYTKFLREHFATVRAEDRDTFDPSTVGDADVVLLDWSQRDVNIMDMSAIASPLGDRAEWSKPTVLLGSAGLLIGGAWQTLGTYG